MKDLRELNPETLKERTINLSQEFSLDTEFNNSLMQSPYLLFRSAVEKFAVKMKKIQEISVNTSITSIPGTPDSIAGVINVRGNIIDVVKFDTLVGLDSELNKKTDWFSSRNWANIKDEKQKVHVIICEVDKKNSFGILVDEVIDIIPVLPDMMEDISDITTEKIKNYIDGVIRWGEEKQEIVSILNIEKVFNAKEFDSLKNIEYQKA